MIRALLFLAALAVTQGAQKSLTAPHTDCPLTGHWLLPHEYDCTKFYYCDRGERFIEPTNCWPNTEFSVTLQGCTHIGASGCTLPGTPPSETATTPVPDSLELLDNGCPVDSHIHMLLPHETSCEKFYYCVHGQKVLSSCDGGTVFNPAIQVCDHPYNVDRVCNDDDVSSNEDNTSDENDSNNGSSQEDDTIESSDENNDNNSNEIDNGCPANGNIHLLLPHETSCTKFYYCVHGQKVLRNCGPGTVFNPDEQVCDHPYNVNRVCSDDETEEDNNVSSNEDNTSVGTDENDSNTGDSQEDDNDSTSNEETIESDENDGSNISSSEENVGGGSTEENDSNDSNDENVSSIENDGNGSNENDDSGSNEGENDTASNESDGDNDDENDPESNENDGSGSHENDPDSNEDDDVSGSNESSGDNGSDEEVNDPDSNENDDSESNEGENDPDSNEDDNDNESNEDDDDEELEILPNGCPIEWSVDKYLPHEYWYCKKSYQCVYGSIEEKVCPVGTHFSYEVYVDVSLKKKNPFATLKICVTC